MPIKGYTQSEEHIKKLIESRGKKKRKYSEEIRRKMSKVHQGNQYALGYKHTGDARKKISEARKGCRCSEETLKKMSEAKKGQGKGKKLSDETRRKIGEANKGEKNIFWQGGICNENKRIRHSIEFKLWREAVFKRDNWICQECNVKSGNGKTVYLHPHHIKAFAKHPEFRFIIDNGITLCDECHKEIHKKQLLLKSSTNIGGLNYEAQR